jgi:SAM-dependent methyltransferase
MIQVIRNTIRENLHDDFSLDGEKKLFDQIVADQKKYAGILRPEKNWDLEIGGQNGERYFYSQKSGETIEFEPYSDDKYYKNFSSLQKMMDPFVGITGLQGINKDVVQEYHTYLKGIDHLGVLSNYFETNGEMKDQANGLMITDLGSIVDVNMISSFLDPGAEKCNILEVGGGYGRLAEVFFNIYGKENIKYVLLDVVPASLMYSYLYLSKNFPDLRIGFYYHEDPFDMDLFDCYIMPSWHFNISTCAGIFDCCINIQSMQEMNQDHVNYYLSMFNDVLKDGSGIAYISNEKDYIFQGEWNYPENWKLLLKTRTPRSWTRNSPTEVFIKSIGSFEKENRLVDAVYSLQLKEFDKNLDQLKIIANLQQEVSNLQLELQKSQQKMSALYLTISRIPLVLENLTIEKTEENIRILNEYYSSKELSDEVLLFENISKINAHLVAVSLYLRTGLNRKALSHLIQIGMMDPAILFSIQTIKIISNGLIYQLRRT